MLTRVVQVQVHLAGVGVGELAELQVDDDETAQLAVEEDEVDPVPLVAHAEPPLPPDEGEGTTELEQKRLELLDEGLFELELRVLVLEVEELENERVLDRLVGRDRVGRLGDLTLRQHAGLVLREQRALVEL